MSLSLAALGVLALGKEVGKPQRALTFFFAFEVVAVVAGMLLHQVLRLLVSEQIEHRRRGFFLLMTAVVSILLVGTPFPFVFACLLFAIPGVGLGIGAGMSLANARERRAQDRAELAELEERQGSG